MRQRPVAIENAGLVTSVGLSAQAACAAIRAGITNPTETRFSASGAEWLMGHQVDLGTPWRGPTRMAKMLAMAVEECLEPVAASDVPSVPLLLCVAEPDRPGRVLDLERTLVAELERELAVSFHPRLSGDVPLGRVSVAVALARARTLLYENDVTRVVIAACDSLLSNMTLAGFAAESRLLTAENSDGFVPGEAAGAILVSRDRGPGPHLVCAGIGVADELALPGQGRPLRADGLTAAIKLALAEAGCDMSLVDFRITDNSGEQYYFKEAALALSRTLRTPKESFDIWHPADCIGEVGAAIGTAAVCVALVACRKGYAIGPTILLHFGNDGGRRAAIVFRYQDTGRG
jgi:3-oxoacyl-[acyl-carrier-protein] synthase-1